MLEQSSGEFAVVAAQLVEAACAALNGDGEMTEARIARAVALLDLGIIWVSCPGTGSPCGDGSHFPCPFSAAGVAASRRRKQTAGVMRQTSFVKRQNRPDG